MTDPLGTALVELSRTFAGDLLRHGDDGYDEARKVHNGLIDKHPAIVARCLGAGDVSKAIRFARAVGLEIAVKGGGHNVAGRATIDDGLLIDLSRMKGLHVQPAARTVRAQGGVTWGEFYKETETHGLSTTGGVVSSTGVGGLSLGGGVGWLMSKHGLTVDNMLEVEIVLANGQITTASADVNADLFWALRGGGGNFGVAASIVYRLHDVPSSVTGGLIAYPFEQAREVIRFYRDREESASDDMVTMVGLVHAPDGSGAKLVAILVCHSGDTETAEKEVADVRSVGTPIMDGIGPIRFSAVNALLDDGFPRGALNYWKSGFLKELTDEAIDALVECFARCPVPLGSMVLEHSTGAVCRTAPDACAYPHRTDGYDLVIVSQWLDPDDTVAGTAWARETHEAMARFSAGRFYVNYLDADDGAAVQAAYGANYERLREIKAKYDPENVFHMNQNIPPAVTPSS